MVIIDFIASRKSRKNPKHQHDQPKTTLTCVNETQVCSLVVLKLPPGIVLFFYILWGIQLCSIRLIRQTESLNLKYKIWQHIYEVCILFITSEHIPSSVGERNEKIWSRQESGKILISTSSLSLEVKAIQSSSTATWHVEGKY